MDYEQFCPKQECDCSNHIRGTVIILVMINLLIDCVASCKRSNLIKELTTENETLKSVILNSVDRVLVKMMKNGNDEDELHEE